MVLLATKSFQRPRKILLMSSRQRHGCRPITEPIIAKGYVLLFECPVPKYGGNLVLNATMLEVELNEERLGHRSGVNGLML